MAQATALASIVVPYLWFLRSSRGDSSGQPDIVVNFMNSGHVLISQFREGSPAFMRPPTIIEKSLDYIGTTKVKYHCFEESPYAFR